MFVDSYGNVKVAQKRKQSRTVLEARTDMTTNYEVPGTVHQLEAHFFPGARF